MEATKGICRVCRNVMGIYDISLKMIDVRCSDLTFGECFEFVTKIEISSIHRQEQYFCAKCASDLATAYKFILRAFESDKEYRSAPLKGNFEYIEVDTNHKVLEKNQQIHKKCIGRTSKNLKNEPVEKFAQGISSEIQQPQDNTPKQIQYMFLCYACPSTFKDKYGLLQHERIHDESRHRNFACDKCEKKFYRRSNFQNHLKTHDVNRKTLFQCDECDKSFFYKGSLTLHKQQHSGYSIECKICQKRYIRPIDLKIHLRSHSGDLPYKCLICEKAFAQLGVLNKHLLHHQGYKYKCDICGKEYAHQSTLIQHRRGHNGLPMKCSICGKGFAEKAKMRRHIGGVHKVRDSEEIDKLIVKVKTKKEYRGRVLNNAT